MRPSVGGDALTRSRKQSFADLAVSTPPSAPGTGMPTTFFMASESMLDGSRAESVGVGSEHTFGVQSLEETIGGAVSQHDGEEEVGDHEFHSNGNRRRSTIKCRAYVSRATSSNSVGQASVSNSEDSSPACLQQQEQHHHGAPSISQPLTPISFASPNQELSPPSSPRSTSTRSFRHSDEELTDDGASQAIFSNGDEGKDAQSPVHEGALQLIMPSIKMPSRRPFTERGKNMGRLKVLLAGDSGVGKSSLVKSIVQICEDIVHVDPLSSNLLSVESLAAKKSKNKLENAHFNSTKNITEVYASTRAYPPWWSDLEESKVLRRRKSAGDTVLERNLCFVDTPGYHAGPSTVENTDAVIQYIETQIMKTTSLASMGNGDLLALLGGSGGSQVDVVFYLVSQHLNEIDIDFIRRMLPMTNVIPVIAKADLLSEAETQILKSSIVAEMQAVGLKPFTFASDFMASDQPFTVCSAASNDAENMDASLLMSPDYVQPLLPSELTTLVGKVFDRDGISWLRHSAAKRIVHWQGIPQTIAQTTSDSLVTTKALQWDYTTNLPVMSSSMSSPATTSQVLISHARNRSSYVQARISDHVQREENLANIHLANWASDLQRSLQNERLRYEALARGEQAVWLTRRLGECVRDGSLVVTAESAAAVEASEKGMISLKDSSFGTLPQRGLTNPTDPLGLIRWNEAMKRHGWIAFQMVGGFGVLGAVAVWVVRNWSTSIDESMGWAWSWVGGAE